MRVLLCLLLVLMSSSCHGGEGQLVCEVFGRREFLPSDAAWIIADDVIDCNSSPRRELWEISQRTPEPRLISSIENPIKKLQENIAMSDTYMSIRKQLKFYIERESLRWGISSNLIAAIIEHESAWNPLARSKRGAIGLMQILPSTAYDYGVFDPKSLYDIEVNLYVGVKHLSSLLKKFKGRIDLTVAAYNAGEGSVMRSGMQIPNIEETRLYVRKIMKSLSQ